MVNKLIFNFLQLHFPNEILFSDVLQKYSKLENTKYTLAIDQPNTVGTFRIVCLIDLDSFIKSSEIPELYSAYN